MNFCEAIFPQRKGPSKLFRVPKWRKGTRDSSSSLVDIDDDFTTAYYYTYVFAKTNLRRESRQKSRSSFFCVMMERPMILSSNGRRSTFFRAAALSVFKKTRRGSGNTTHFCGGSLYVILCERLTLEGAALNPSCGPRFVAVRKKAHHGEHDFISAVRAAFYALR